MFRQSSKTSSVGRFVSNFREWQLIILILNTVRAVIVCQSSQFSVTAITEPMFIHRYAESAATAGTLALYLEHSSQKLRK
jgi:hypothetical protein